MNPFEDQDEIIFDAEKNKLELKGKNILLVEDNPDQQIIYQHMLIKLSTNVEVVDNGTVALELIKSGKTKFDAVILDFFMPGMNGMETSKAIRKSGYKSPIIGMTAQYEEVNKYEWFMAGCDVILKKPILGEQFIKHISYCFALENKLPEPLHKT